MKPVFGFGIAREEHFSLLPPTLPDEFSFLEVPGEILESRKICADLERYSARQRKAVVIRDIVQSYLADSAPFFPLHLKVEFDRKFRERCEAAARLKCRIISADFNLARALGDPVYKKNLLNLLRSIAGILDEFKFIMIFSIHCLYSFFNSPEKPVPNMASMTTVSGFKSSASKENFTCDINVLSILQKAVRASPFKFCAGSGQSEWICMSAPGTWV